MSGESAARPLAIVGPTASGKSALALELARRAAEFGIPTETDDRSAARTTEANRLVNAPVEFVSVDSMQVYRGMDIGTAKPTRAEQADVRHHLIDLVEPTERFTVVDFAAAFDAVMADIQARGATPLLVGGTGLYLRAVIDGLTPPPEFPELSAALYAEVQQAGADAGSSMLHRRLAQLDPVAASRMEPTNLRRVVRALSVCGGTGRPFSSFGPGLQEYPEVPYRLIGIDIERDTLDARITQRYGRQLDAGFVEEVRALSKRSLSPTASQALGYKDLLAHLAGECSLDEAVETAVTRTRRFARRQQRWLARDPRITWIPFAEASVMADHVEQIVVGDVTECH